MEENKHIEECIVREKKVFPAPFLVGRIMAGIEQDMVERSGPKYIMKNIARSVAVAAGVLLMVALGVAIGNIYDSVQQAYDEELALNDSHIEQFSIYIEDEN